MIGNINDKVNEKRKKKKENYDSSFVYIWCWYLHVRLFGESRKVVKNLAIISHAIYFVLVNGNSRY